MNARRVAHALTMLVLTGAVSLSGRVEAQQTGLFPLAPIRRQRVPCSQEDPTYKIYKQQYFGYHPTCWRTFPPGWGCPSAQAPNREQSFRELPLGVAREGLEEGFGMPPGEERGAPPGRERPDLPPLPREERSPFEPDAPAGGVPGANPMPPRGTPPARTPARPERSPFDEIPNPGASLAPSRGRGGAADGAPELTAPARQPAEGSAFLDRRGGDDEDLAAGEGRPLLGLSDADIVRSDSSSADDSLAEVPAINPPESSASTAPAPAAPPRRRLFGHLFSGLGSSWTRR